MVTDKFRSYATAKLEFGLSVCNQLISADHRALRQTANNM